MIGYGKVAFVAALRALGWVLTVNVPLAKLGLAFAGLTCVLLAGEGAIRIHHRLAHNVPMQASLARLGEYPLGWGARRVWGDPQSLRPRLLVLGDSLTEGRGIPDADLYFTVLGRLLDVEGFAIGGAGYGTLQEALALEQFLTVVTPDLVLLQVTSNDFINNSWELESASWGGTNLRVRPYLVGGQVVYRFPSRHQVVEQLLTHSRLAHVLTAGSLQVGTLFAYLDWVPSVERRIELEGPAFSGFERSMRTTEQIIARMKARLGAVALVAFAADAPNLEHWRAVCARVDVPLLEDVPARIEAEEAKRRTSLRPDGAHWNAEAHRIVGELLAQRLAGQIPR